MTIITYSSLALDWSPQHKQDRFFKQLTMLVVVLAFSLGLVVSMIKLPVEERRAKSVIPERVANFIMQKEKPKVIKIKPKPKPKPKPVARVIKRVKKNAKIDKPLTKLQKTARKKAESSGLLALNNELSDLMDTSSVNEMVANRVKRSSTGQQAVSVNKNVLSVNAAKGSGGINKEHYVTHVSKTVLSQEERLAFKQSLTSTGKLKGKNHTTRTGNVRSEEDVIYVMDQNKSKLHSIYRRARRSDPGLKGKIILEITIAPSGKVLKVRVKSSELNNPGLEAKLVARIKRFDFGISTAEKVTVTFPIEFLPS